MLFCLLCYRIVNNIRLGVGDTMHERNRKVYSGETNGPVVEEQSKINSSERGIFGNGASPEARILSYEMLSEYTKAFEILGLKTVLTSGSFDLLHIGHERYLEEARKHGDILIVGVDSDDRIKKRKGPTRPIIPEEERVEMLTHLRHVDIVTIKGVNDEKWELIKLVKPDTLIVTEETYNEETRLELLKYCGKLVSLEPQATTSTSARIRKSQISEQPTEQVKAVEEILEQGGVSEEIRHKIGRLLLRGVINQDEK